MTTHQPDFLIKNSTNHQIYFTLRAANHEVVLTSETYTSLSATQNGIEAVRTAASSSTSFSSRYSHDGQPYFVLRAANHEVVGTSEMYSSDNERDKGILACQRAAREAQVVDGR